MYIIYRFVVTTQVPSIQKSDKNLKNAKILKIRCEFEFDLMYDIHM